MILSTSHNFIFVHIPKTAGLAVTDAFARFDRGSRRSVLRSLSRRLPFREAPETAHFREHEPVRTIIRKLGRETFDGFTSFSVVRNPFTHAVSHYEYMKQFRIASTAKKVAGMSFEDYLVYRQEKPFWNDTIFARLPDQTYFLTDNSGAQAVQRLVRFESLNDDLMTLAGDLGLDGVELKHVNKTKVKKHDDLSKYYTGPCKDLVLKIYDRDFDALGYGRDLPA